MEVSDFGHSVDAWAYMLVGLRPNTLVTGLIWNELPMFQPPIDPVAAVPMPPFMCAMIASQTADWNVIWSAAIPPLSPWAVLPTAVRVKGGVWLPHVYVLPVMLLPLTV